MKAIRTFTVHCFNNDEPEKKSYKASVGVSYKKGFTLLSSGFDVEGKSIKAVMINALKKLEQIDNGKDE